MRQEKTCYGNCGRCRNRNRNTSSDKGCEYTFDPIDDSPDEVVVDDDKKPKRFCKKCNNQGHYFRPNGKMVQCENCK